MIKQIKEKIYLAALAIPAFAVGTDYNVKTDTAKTGDYEEMTTLSLGSIIGWLVGLVFIIASVIFFFILVFGGIKWITSGGDEKKVAAARASITSALVGLAIVFAAWAIMTLLGKLLGFDIFNFTFKALV